MNDQFDELAKGLAQSVTRRGALKRFGAGLAGIVVACFGPANKAQASYHCDCKGSSDFGCSARYGTGTEGYLCTLYCESHCRHHKPGI